MQCTLSNKLSNVTNLHIYVFRHYMCIFLYSAFFHITFHPLSLFFPPQSIQGIIINFHQVVEFIVHTLAKWLLYPAYCCSHLCIKDSAMTIQYGCESIVWAVVHGFVCHYLVLLVEVEWITAGIEQVLSHNLITHFLTCGKIRNKILIRGNLDKPTRFHYCNERQIK